MHAVAAFFAGIVTFVSGFFGSSLFASNSPVNVSTTQPAAAGTAQTEIVGDTFNDPATVLPVTEEFAAVSLSPQDAAEILSGRVLGEQAVTVSPSFLSQFSQFLRSFDAYLASPLASGATAYPRYGGYLPQSDGTTALSSPTITGGSITNASSGSFDALSAGTLALSGALTGTDAAFSGTLSAGTLNVAGVSSGGAITGPYFTATSTTATSTFAGGLTAANGSFSILQNGNVGVGTTTPGGNLVVNGTTGQNLLQIATSTQQNIFTINQYGNVSVGVAPTPTWYPTLATFHVGTDQNIALRSSIGLSRIEAFNDAVSANVPLDFAASRFSFTAGNVSIGTTTPWAKLSIKGSGAGTGLAFAVADSANTPRFAIQDNGNVGIGTSTPSYKLDVFGNARFGDHPTNNLVAGQTGYGLAYVGSQTAGWSFGITSDGGTTFPFVVGGGNVGIGTTTPSAQLTTTGTVRFSNFGAGSLQTDANGNVSVSSDERLKHIDGDFTRGLADVLQLSPIQYHWNPLSGLDTNTQYAGFSAQNVRDAIPEAVGENPNGYLSLNDRPVLAAVVNAIKELATKLDTLTAAVSGFAERFTTGELFARKARIDELCVGSVCVTEQQFLAMATAGGSYTIITSNQPAPPLPEPDNDNTATSTATTTPPPSPSEPAVLRTPLEESATPAQAEEPAANDNAPSTSPDIIETATAGM